MSTYQRDAFTEWQRKTLVFFFISAYNMSRKGVLDMAHTVNVNFKLDEDVKKRMERACAEMGLSMSAAFTMFAKKVGREYRIPFEISADPFYSERNLRYLESVMQDVKDGKAHFAEHDLIEVD
jgi:DNA-damage-inducible protein J